MNKRVDENICKYCFDYCRLGNFNEGLIEKLGKKFGVLDETIRDEKVMELIQHSFDLTK